MKKRDRTRGKDFSPGGVCVRHALPTDITIGQENQSRLGSRRRWEWDVSVNSTINGHKRRVDDMTSFEECVRFANEHIICSVATVDGDRPRVRMLGMWFADRDGFCFSTVKTKELYRQLGVNPRVELCFYAPPKQPLGQEGSTDIGKMMRVSGEATFLADANLKERLLSERPFLRANAENQVIFRVQNGEAWFWTSQDSGRESTIERIRF